MLFWLTFVFIFMPALEFYLLFTVGGQIGIGNTFFVILLTGILGAYLARINGLSVLANIQKELQEGKIPGKQIIHAFLVFGGGLLLLTPGFVTDLIGFSMVLPLTRIFYVGLANKWFEKGIQSGNVQFYNFGGAQFRSRNNNSNPMSHSQQEVGSIVEAEFTKKDN